MSEVLISSTLRQSYPEIFFFIDRDECGLGYSPRFREFFLRARPGSAAVQLLQFCPFSGKSLPSSLRDRFFDELEALGLQDGLSDVDLAPEEFQGEAWWLSRNI